MLQVTKFAPNHVELEAYGKLEKRDYEQVVPQLEEAVQEGKRRVIVRLDDFHGWTPTAFIEELRFDMRHRHDFEKVAVVGDARLIELVTKITAPFWDGEVRFFREMGAARAWMAS